MPYKLFDIPVFAEDLTSLLTKFPRQGVVLSFNPEIVMAIARYPQLREFFKTNPWNLIDGVGIAWALRKKYKKRFPRVSGIDLVTQLLAQGGKFFIVGAAPVVLDQALQKIKTQFPQAEIVGSQSGYYDKSFETQLVEKIQQSQAQYLLVGMGFPRQEQFVFHHPQLVEDRVAIMMGGSLDVLAGIKKRAPRWMQVLGVEWLFRLGQEPKRFWRMRVLPLFALKVLLTRSL
jgi:N-acetylglucosaminyldiphosphoundecaprenol N-acetyl-beta-D-mannosaminyltransferase